MKHPTDTFAIRWIDICLSYLWRYTFLHALYWKFYFAMEITKHFQSQYGFDFRYWVSILQLCFVDWISNILVFYGHKINVLLWMLLSDFCNINIFNSGRQGLKFTSIKQINIRTWYWLNKRPMWYGNSTNNNLYSTFCNAATS